MLVIGAGMIGLLILQAARAAGCGACTDCGRGSRRGWNWPGNWARTRRSMSQAGVGRKSGAEVIQTDRREGSGCEL